MVNKVASKIVNIAIKALILGFALSACSAIAQPLALPDNLISVTTDSGKNLLSTSQAKKDYSPLSKYFVTQSPSCILWRGKHGDCTQCLT